MFAPGQRAPCPTGVCVTCPKEQAMARHLDPDILDCLQDVMDPEIGLSVVDLGLVYQAGQDDHGIDVALTLTTRACPLGEMIVEDARARLVSRFPDAPGIAINLVW